MLPWLAASYGQSVEVEEPLVQLHCQSYDLCGRVQAVSHLQASVLLFNATLPAKK